LETARRKGLKETKEKGNGVGNSEEKRCERGKEMEFGLKKKLLMTRTKQKRIGFCTLAR
jgi:hypothetical protein